MVTHYFAYLTTLYHTLYTVEVKYDCVL